MKKRYKKILLYGSMFLVMNILFAACTGEVKETVLPNASPTVTVTVTKQPENTQAATTIKPTKEPELTPSPTEEPRQHITPMLAATVTPSVAPTEIPTAAPTVTSTPVLQPTAIPHLTEIPHLTATPISQPTVVVTLQPSPTMLVTPTPAKDPLTLVYAGWQQVTDLSGQYMVVFPDIYDKVTLKKEADFFKYVYTASAIPNVKWELSFNTEETVNVRQQKIIEQYPEMKVKPQADGFAYYAETDTVFVAGEVYAWNYKAAGIQGVMHIENSYPKEKKEEYQKEMYHWYVCISKEE